MKLQFLPALPLRVWLALWAIAMLGSLGNWLGSRWLGLFEFSDDINTASMISMLLLAFTPLHFPPRSMWAVMTPDGWVEVSEQDAKVLCERPDEYRVRRLVVQGGKVLEEHDV